MPIHFKLVSALEKIFPDQEPPGYPASLRLSGFQNEVLSLQAAWTANEAIQGDPRARVRFETRCDVPVRVRQVIAVPVRFPCFPDTDEHYLRKTPGLYPDLLRDLTETTHLRAYQGIWNAVWMDIEPDGIVQPGHYTLTCLLKTMDGQVVAEQAMPFDILPGFLPRQRLIHTRWLHADCLAGYYGVPVLSDAHFDILENYIRLAVKRGCNMILTPTHTPPLDTAVGGERPTVQLVDIQQQGDRYAFGFDKLHRFVDICRRAGAEYFEIAHLFTQWGAYFAPKIMAVKDGMLQRIFGWDTPALSDAYRGFLAQYLPALTDELKKLGIADKTYFHLSDEPSKQHIDQYLQVKDMTAPYLKGFPVIDALSDISFYTSGAVAHPIPAINHIEPFLAENIPNLWTYYCVGQHRYVTNTFIAMPAHRTRILGVQLYQHNIGGFLQWAYNYYYAQYSDYPVDPYLITDADGFAPAGDAFQVYPGPGGQPEESLRLMLFMQAMQDLRALAWAEEIMGRDKVLAAIAQGLDKAPTLADYPRDSAYLLDLRERINRLIVNS